jgi:hypothetical protein
MQEIIGTIGFFIIVFLPGAWITFGPLFLSWGFWTRICMGAVLSPLVVCVQFYLIRILGVPFEVTVFLLVVINLPVVILIWKQYKNVQFPSCKILFQWGILFIIPLACFSGPLLYWPQWRLFCGHPWMHADITYTFANGELVPKDPVLSGVVLSYPWVGHLYQAILSYLIDSPPISSYRWTNLLWLILILQVNTGLVKKLGGNRFAAMSSMIWLLFGINIFGYLLSQILPDEIVNTVSIWGDYRYTPWLLKFCHFNPMPFAMGFFICITYLMVEKWQKEHVWKRSLLLFLFIISLGLVYPVYLAPAYGVVFAAIVAALFDKEMRQQFMYWRYFLLVGFAVFLGTIISKYYLNFVTQDSYKATMLSITELRGVVRKSLEIIIVTFPLLCLLASIFINSLKAKKFTTLVLVLGAFSSFILCAFLHIPYFSNEYKFMFTAGICLAPFAGISMQNVEKYLGRWKITFLFFLSIFLAWPFFHKIYRNPFPQEPERLLRLDISEFNLRLDKNETFSKIADKIREETPLDTVLVIDKATFHVPTIVQRKLFAPPNEVTHTDGLALTYETYLQGVRGYDDKLIKQRQIILAGLFDQQNANLRMESLECLLEMRKPIGIVIEQNRHQNLLSWLKKNKIGTCIYTDDRYLLWLIMPGQA